MPRGTARRLPKCTRFLGHGRRVDDVAGAVLVDGGNLRSRRRERGLENTARGHERVGLAADVIYASCGDVGSRHGSRRRRIGIRGSGCTNSATDAPDGEESLVRNNIVVGVVAIGTKVGRFPELEGRTGDGRKAPAELDGLAMRQVERLEADLLVKTLEKRSVRKIKIDVAPRRGELVDLRRIGTLGGRQEPEHLSQLHGIATRTQRESVRPGASRGDASDQSLNGSHGRTAGERLQRLENEQVDHNTSASGVRQARMAVRPNMNLRSAHGIGGARIRTNGPTKDALMEIRPRERRGQQSRKLTSIKPGVLVHAIRASDGCTKRLDSANVGIRLEHASRNGVTRDLA